MTPSLSQPPSREVQGLRVLMTADTVGGVWTYVLELAHALAPYEAQIALATMGKPLTASQWEAVAACPNVQVYESTYKLEWMDDPWSDVVAAGEWLLDLEAEFKPDVVHLNGYVHAALPWKTPVVVAGHSCVLSWWQAVKGGTPPSQWAQYQAAVARGIAAASAVIAPTHAMLMALETHYGAFPNGQVVANGRTAAMYQAAQVAKAPFILTAGRVWDEAKNVAALCAVAPSLRWPVYVAGETQHPDSGHVTIHNVNFLGRLTPDVLAGWMGEAAIFALPARYEPFGFSPLEAALAGCALVLGDIPSLREVWGNAAVFVPPDDLDALTRALNWLADDEPARLEYARRAYAHAQQYTPEACAFGTLQVYETVLQKTPLREVAV